MRVEKPVVSSVVMELLVLGAMAVEIPVLGRTMRRSFFVDYVPRICDFQMCAFSIPLCERGQVAQEEKLQTRLCRNADAL